MTRTRLQDYIAFLEGSVPEGYEIRIKFRDADGAAKLATWSYEDRRLAARWMREMHRKFGWRYARNRPNRWKKSVFFLARLPKDAC